MVKLIGKFCFFLALFLIPLSLRALNNALDMTGESSYDTAGSGAWIFFTMLSFMTLVSGWVGLKTIRR